MSLVNVSWKGSSLAGNVDFTLTVKLLPVQNVDGKTLPVNTSNFFEFFLIISKNHLGMKNMENKELEKLRTNLNLKTVRAYLDAKGNPEILDRLDVDLECIINEAKLLQIDVRNIERIHR